MTRLHQRIRETFLDRHRGDDERRRWSEACEEFHAFNDPLFDLWRPEVLAEVATRGGAWRDAALLFLEADPWFFRSGYLKEKLLRRLKQAQLDETERRRMNHLLLRAVDGRPRREFRDYCRVAQRFASPALRELVESRLEDPDEGRRVRAQRMLQYINGSAGRG